MCIDYCHVVQSDDVQGTQVQSSSQDFEKNFHDPEVTLWVQQDSNLSNSNWAAKSQDKMTICFVSAKHIFHFIVSEKNLVTFKYQIFIII